MQRLVTAAAGGGCGCRCAIVSWAAHHHAVADKRLLGLKLCHCVLEGSSVAPTGHRACGPGWECVCSSTSVLWLVAAGGSNSSSGYQKQHGRRQQQQCWWQ